MKIPRLRRNLIPRTQGAGLLGTDNEQVCFCATIIKGIKSDEALDSVEGIDKNDHDTKMANSQPDTRDPEVKNPDIWGKSEVTGHHTNENAINSKNIINGGNMDVSVYESIEET